MPKKNIPRVIRLDLEFLVYMVSSVSGQDESNSCAVIGFPIGQDGAILPFWDYSPCPARKFPRKPSNKSFIEKACSVKMA